MENETLFRDKPVWTAIFSMAIPAVVTILIMVIYNMADMFFIGLLGDDTQVAAVAVVSPVFNLANALSTMLGAGGCAVIAKALGARETENAKTVGSLCSLAALAFGLIFACMMLAATDPVLRALGATDDMKKYAGTYLRILAFGSPLMLYGVAIASVIRAEGAVIHGMISNIAGTVTNLILDPVFILWLDLGIAGAAAATVLGNLVSCILLLRYIYKHSTVLRFSLTSALRKPSLLIHTMAVGLPNGISSILSGFASTFSNQLLSLYGSSAIAAMAAASRSTLVITMVQMGICLGASPLIAYNHGAGNLPRLQEILQKISILTVAFGLAAAGACYLGRDALIGLFLKDAANAEAGGKLMFYLIIASPLLGLYYLGSNFLQAAGNAFLATVISILRQGLLLIPCLYLLHACFGLTGIAAAHTVSDLLAVVIALFCTLWQYQKLKKSFKTRC